MNTEDFKVKVQIVWSGLLQQLLFTQANLSGRLSAEVVLSWLEARGGCERTIF